MRVSGRCLFEQEDPLSTALAKWNEYTKLYFPDYVVDPAPTDYAALLRHKADPSVTFVINMTIITALSKQYNKGFDDGYADASDERDFNNINDGDTDVYRDGLAEEVGELVDEIPFPEKVSYGR